ncbi:Abhydrolase domain containing 14A [Podarcis lilfordi]|uniref:Abhydrolase domain containing 14A n=1 Tax=Podarcis lilfordi TaxID=74358 RepID=A0AA35JW25_9SAUR|nr:Abhydrolase domain containing 14A [Podarcis lilfordi]
MHMNMHKATDQAPTTPSASLLPETPRVAFRLEEKGKARRLTASSSARPRGSGAGRLRRGAIRSEPAGSKCVAGGGGGGRTQLPPRLLSEEKMTMTLIRNRLGLLVLGVLVTFVLYLLLPAIQHERFTSSVDIPKPRAMEEEMNKGQGTGNITILTGTVLQNPSVFFREAVQVQKDGPPFTERLAVIFLHGQSFNSKKWEELGTLALLSENGYRAIAIDLPGYGESPSSSTVETAQGRVAFLQQVFKELGLQQPVLISSSMSGRYSIPFLLASGEQLKGFVPIAPVGTKDFTSQQYQQVKIPTLIIYGERDTGLGTQSLQSLQQIPQSRVVMLLGAGHACYLDKPQEFHKALLNFLGELK